MLANWTRIIPRFLIKHYAFRTLERWQMGNTICIMPYRGVFWVVPDEYLGK